MAAERINLNGSGEGPNSMSSRQQADAAHRCQQHNRAENPAEWIDSPNELIDRPDNGRHCPKDVQRGRWCPPFWVMEPPRRRQGEGDRQCDIWPLGDREATSSAVDEHPSNASSKRRRAAPLRDRLMRRHHGHRVHRCHSQAGAASPGEAQPSRQLQCQTNRTRFDPRIDPRNQRVARSRAPAEEDSWPPRPAARTRWRSLGMRRDGRAVPPLLVCRVPQRPARRGLLQIARVRSPVGQSS